VAARRGSRSRAGGSPAPSGRWGSWSTTRSAPRLRLPLAREFADLWRGNLHLDPREGVTTLLLVASLALLAFGVFAHLRPLVHLLVDRGAGTVSWMRCWRPQARVAIESVGTVTITSDRVGYDVKYQTGQVARRQLTIYRVRLGAFEHSVFDSSRRELATLKAERLARLLGTRVV
jgi:hypothetical protein